MTLQDATRRLSALALMAAGTFGAADAASAQVPLKAALGLKPKQADVPYDTPTAEQMKQTKIEQRRFPQGSGYIVIGPDGQTLRELVDTTKDDKLNEFRFFQLGLETYREVDTNGDGRADGYRWFNTAGTRWGVDENRDAKIDRWKRLSAEEATREAVAALATADVARMQAVLFDARDAKALGMSDDLAAQVLARSGNVEKQMQDALASKRIDKRTRWERFDSAMLMPILVPAESGRADRDMLAYENVTAIARTGSDDVFLNVGEVIQVGDVFKLTRVPQPLDTTQQVVTDAGLLVQPPSGLVGAAPSDFPPAMRKLVDRLQALDGDRPQVGDGREAMVKYNVERAKLLQQIVDAAPNDALRTQFQQQRIDGIAAAALLNAYPNPLETMQELEGDVSDEFKPYVTYRRIQVEYSKRAGAAEADEQADVQAWYLSEIEKFIRKYPKSDDAADAIWQLGSALEMQGETKKATDWYNAGAKGFPNSIPGQKAAGAVRRIGLKGDTMELSGELVGGGTLDLDQYRGKVVAVAFWTTWAAPFNQQLPELLELRKEYAGNGFEVVGVNIDPAGSPVAQYMEEQKIGFPVLDGNAGSQAQGSDSEIARRFGIIQLPTYFLLDRRGKVVSNASSIEELQNLVPKLLLKK